jgi:hypothetical protein
MRTDFKSDVRDIAEQIVATGAIMTLPGVPLVRQLVGHLQWVDEHRLFWFTAFGDTTADGHAVAFEEIQGHPVGVCFVAHGVIAAFLAPIDKAAVEDPEDYRVAWRLWQEVLPMRQQLINDALAKLLTDPRNGATNGLTPTGGGRETPRSGWMSASL